MHRLTFNLSSLSWNVSAVELDSDGYIDFACTHCEAALVIHQPDELLPHRLLGTCARCGTWQIIELEQEGAQAMTLTIPDLALVRSVLTHANGTAEVLKDGSSGPLDPAQGLDREGQVA